MPLTKPLTKESEDLIQQTVNAIRDSKSSKMIMGNSQLVVGDIEAELEGLMGADGKCKDRERQIELHNQLRLIQEANTGIKSPKESQGWIRDAVSCFRKQATWGNFGLLVCAVGATAIFGVFSSISMGFSFSSFTVEPGLTFAGMICPPLGVVIASVSIAVILFKALSWLFKRVYQNEDKIMKSAQQELATQLRPMSGTGAPSTINVKSDRAAPSDFTSRDFSKGYRK